MNYGYWDSKVNSRVESLNRLYEKISEKLGNFSRDTKLLDAGCGVGEACRWFATNKKYSVTGVTISKRQVEFAKKIFKNSKLNNKLRIIEGDYTKLSFDNNTFNCAIAVETICHLEDRTPFYQEIFRVLKPGGKLVVAEYTTNKPLSFNEDVQRMRRLEEGWAMNPFWSENKHLEAMKEIGFENVSVERYSDKTVKSAKFLYKHSIPGILLYRILKLFGLVTRKQLKNAVACRCQWETKKKGLWDHSMFVAQKPLPIN